MTPDERWLAAVWPFVRAWLPGPPAAVVEIGCGPLGGFVPMLRSAGYDAAGVDPKAPDGPWYHRVEFERYEMPGPAKAVVACTSLHHVADVGQVLNLAAANSTLPTCDGATMFPATRMTNKSPKPWSNTSSAGTRESEHPSTTANGS